MAQKRASRLKELEYFSENAFDRFNMDIEVIEYASFSKTLDKDVARQLNERPFQWDKLILDTRIWPVQPCALKANLLLKGVARTLSCSSRDLRREIKGGWENRLASLVRDKLLKESRPGYYYNEIIYKDILAGNKYLIRSHVASLFLLVSSLLYLGPYTRCPRKRTVEIDTSKGPLSTASYTPGIERTRIEPWNPDTIVGPWKIDSKELHGSVPGRGSTRQGERGGSTR